MSIIAVNPRALGYAAGEELRLTADGRIIDFLDPSVSRPNTPEERVRQNYTARLHHEYRYPKDVMLLSAPISMGSSARQADIAIYRTPVAAQQHDQGNIRLIVETKAPDVKGGIEQLKSYIFATSAEGGVWINETDAPKYFRRVDVPNSRLEEWPNIPRVGETWDGIGKHTKRRLRSPHNLVEVFKRCHNALYKVGIDSEDIAMDMVRIILAKYRDEMNEGDIPEFRVTPLELQSAEGRRRVAQRVRTLFHEVRDDNRDVFDTHETITAGDREIATVASELQDFRFLPDEESDEVYDVVGAAYEVYVGSHLKGDRGQYFTHRLIVQLVVRLVDPDESAIIFDPAMGSGGFLIFAMRHVSRKITASHRTATAKRAAISNLHKRIFGVDKSPKLVKVARTNMILASDGHSGLVHGDSLEPLSKLPASLLRKAGPEIPTVVLTNPPFGATAEHRITPETEPELLAQFEVAKVWRRTEGELRPTDTFVAGGVPPEYLFVERCLQWVAPGGRIGIIVPRGLLDNDRALPVRTLIMREARVVAVVNCHDDTFKPHTDAKTAILVLEKKRGGREPHEDYPIFMAISQGIGHNGVGEPIYKTDAQGDIIVADGEPVLDHDIDEIHSAWLMLRQGRKLPSGFYFTIPRSKIADGDLALNPVRYLPRYSTSLRRALELGEQDGWEIQYLGDIADVFGGPRFKRPYADKRITSGEGIVRFFTGNAVTQTRGENVKYLDLRKAKPAQLRMIKQLYLSRGMILITRSGTVGRVVYATAYHDGAVGTEDVIRVVISDEALRGYVYQFLLSELGQNQLRANIYGAIVDHIEAAHVKKVAIPVPKDRTVLEAIGLPVVRSMELQEHAYAQLEDSRLILHETLGGDDEDAVDAVAVRELLADPQGKGRLVTGEELRSRLERCQT